MFKALVYFLLFGLASGFDYGLIVDTGELSFGDVETQINPIQTLFLDQEASVTVGGLAWEQLNASSSDDLLFYETFVDGQLQSSGNMSLADVGRELPSSVSAGTIIVTKRGTAYVTVFLKVGDSEAVVTGTSMRSFKAGVSVIPLLIILILAMTTHMVRFKNLVFALNCP
jgi:hypothetical protein